LAVRASQAFAAFRQSLVSELSNKVYEELQPHFNAEAEDIRRRYSDSVKDAADANTENSKKKLLELAESNKKARILDLAKRKNDFIASLKVRLNLEITERLTEYKAEVFEEKEPREGKPDRIVKKAKFPDGSMAKVPQNLYIDYSGFQRV